MKIFPAIRIEGGLFAPDLLDQLLAEELPGQKPRDFGLDDRRSMTDEIASVFAEARHYWQAFQHRLARLSEKDSGTSETRDLWVVPLLTLLGHELQYNRKARIVGGLTFAVSHRSGEAEDAPPVHIVGIRQELGRVAPGGPRLAPHALVQEYLNRTESLWGLVTNGRVLRLLRDSTYIRRQCYVEFDLEAIFEQRLFEDFAALYRLLHRSRFPRPHENASECLLEKYHQRSLDQGERVRDRLRDGVEECLVRLANGFLAHPRNQKLRSHLELPPGDPEHISAEALYGELLRLVYRFLFLLVSEDRGLVSQNRLYLEHYGLGRFRRLVDNPAAFTDHDDLWLSLRVLWRVLDGAGHAGGEPLASLLGLPVLDGQLFKGISLDDCFLANRDLLAALWHLLNYRESPSSPPRRVNYAALDVEELGSVYESLLDYRPILDLSGARPTFALHEGSERKSTGSYYTPAKLVGELVRSALEPVIQERLEEAKRTARGESRRAAEEALLGIRVLDPACGSGHFLLAAARRLGKELARVRTGEEEPPPERVREAIRDVVAHCIYGVDKNPLAVELCRVALWIESHAPGKPLAFLDHRIRCGDSLVGVLDLSVLEEGIPDEAFKPVSGDDRTVARDLLAENRKQRAGQPTLFGSFDGLAEVRNLAAKAWEIERIPDDSPRAIREKEAAYRELQRMAQRDRTACDLWTAAFFQPKNRSVPPAAWITTESLRRWMEGRGASGAQVGHAAELAEKHRFFHWPLEFPEVFAGDRVRPTPSKKHRQAGSASTTSARQTSATAETFHPSRFDVVLGNPPHGADLRPSELRFLQYTYPEALSAKNSAAYFLALAYRITTSKAGRIGFVMPKSLTYSYTWRHLRQFFLPSLAAVLDIGQFWSNVLLEQVLVSLRVGALTPTTISVGRLDPAGRSASTITPALARLLDILPTGLTDDDFDLVSVISNSPIRSLGELCKTFRGAHLQPFLGNTGDVPVLSGRDISPFHPPQPRLFIRSNELNATVRSAAPGQPVFQNILAHLKRPADHIRLIGTIVDRPLPCLDTVNLIALNPDSPLTAYGLCAFLMSDLVNRILYVLIYNRSARTMHLDQYFLSRLPVPAMLCADLDRIGRALFSDPENPRLWNELNEVVYELYRTPKSVRDYVRRTSLPYYLLSKVKRRR